MLTIPRTKRPELDEFIKAEMEAGNSLEPSVLRDKYKENYRRIVDGKEKPYGAGAFTMRLKRMGITIEQRKARKAESKKEVEVKDVTEFEEWESYLESWLSGGADIHQKKRTLGDVRRVLFLMRAKGHMNPRKYTFRLIHDVLAEELGTTEDGAIKQRGTAYALFGAYNRVFTGRLPRGAVSKYKSKAGALKDFFTYKEFQLFDSKIEDTRQLSREGFRAMFKTQLNIGCREGSGAKKGQIGKDGVLKKLTATGGILSLLWDNIDYEAKRCKINDKGTKGARARLWKMLPLDLFEWIEGFEALMTFHEKTHGYRPTNEKHAHGRCFPISYDYYLKEFHNIRHRCKPTRIGQDTKTMKPHIFRRTHGQWCKRLGISLENICGEAGEADAIGMYGVGWTNPDIPLKWYLSVEAYEYEEQDAKIKKRMEERVKPKLRELGII